MNKVTLIGNCGADPEVNQVNENLKVATLSLATSEKRGEENVSEWHNLKAFNQLAEIFEKHVHKGDKIAVVGKIQTRSWEKDNVKHYRTEILVNEIEFLTPKS
jgi:single-strand DNA-binding protein